MTSAASEKLQPEQDENNDQGEQEKGVFHEMFRPTLWTKPIRFLQGATALRAKTGRFLLAHTAPVGQHGFHASSGPATATACLRPFGAAAFRHCPADAAADSAIRRAAMAASRRCFGIAFSRLRLGCASRRAQDICAVAVAAARAVTDNLLRGFYAARYRNPALAVRSKPGHARPAR